MAATEGGFLGFGGTRLSEAEQALIAATINAASVLGHVDTQTGLLKRASLDKAIKEAKHGLAVQRWTL